VIRRILPIVAFLTLAVSCTAAGDVLGPVSSGGSSHIVPTLVAPVELESIDACIGMPSAICRNRASYLVGDHPQIVAFVSPPDVAQRAVLWRRDGAGPWERIGSRMINDRGTAVWRWDTTSADARTDSAWWFKYTIGGTGASDVVRLRIIPPPF
jgi:hypothetical protein